MIVLYLKENNLFLQAIKGFPEVEERDNKLYFKGGKVIVNDLTKVGYREYPDQGFEIPTEYDEETETIVEVPVTLDELNLRGFEILDLPVSQHLARIKIIDVSRDKPITVERKFAGQNFDIPCVVTENIKDQFLAGDINIGDIVIVTYCEETMDDAIVTNKVFKSW